jgi:CRP-like cAMP-binding protein
MPEQQKKSKSAAVARLEEMLNAFHPVSAELGKSLLDHSRLLRLKRGEYLLRKGEECRHYFFIIKGVMRAFMDDEHHEITSWVTLEGEIVSSIHSLLDSSPCLENIQAVENSLLVCLQVADMDRLYQKFPELNVIVRKILMQYYRDAEYRAVLARIPGADRKYEFFLTHYPHLVNRIPLKVIASFLGLRYETLSRIRSRINADRQAVDVSSVPLGASDD